MPIEEQTRVIAIIERTALCRRDALEAVLTGQGRYEVRAISGSGVGGFKCGKDSSVGQSRPANGLEGFVVKKLLQTCVRQVSGIRREVLLERHADEHAVIAAMRLRTVEEIIPSRRPLVPRHQETAAMPQPGQGLIGQDLPINGEVGLGDFETARPGAHGLKEAQVGPWQCPCVLFQEFDIHLVGGLNLSRETGAILFDEFDKCLHARLRVRDTSYRSTGPEALPGISRTMARSRQT